LKNQFAQNGHEHPGILMGKIDTIIVSLKSASFFDRYFIMFGAWNDKYKYKKPEKKD